MDSTFDLIVIGAGPGGEAITHKARWLGAAVAVIDRRWFGGSCPHILNGDAKAWAEQSCSKCVYGPKTWLAGRSISTN